jgi:hypothetical protein
MIIRRRPELITGAVLAIFGIFVIHQARELSYSSEFGPGPGFFPLWVGLGILLCSVVMLCGSFAGAENDEATRISGRSLSAWVAFVCALALLPLLGFAVSLALLAGFMILVLDQRSPATALAVALGLAAGFHLVFSRALGVSLPPGAFGF